MVLKDFVDKLPDISLVLSCSVEGVEKEGKTTFALSAPPPVAIISLDPGTLRAIRNYKRAHPKWKYQYAGPFNFKPKVNVGEDTATAQRVADEARVVWKQFRDAYYTACESREIRSVIVDTGDKAYETLQLSRFGKLSSNFGGRNTSLWGLISSEMAALIQAPGNVDKNSVWIHRLKDEYKEDKRTGQQVPKGWKDVGFEVDTVVRVSREEGEFHVRIRKSGLNVDVEDMDLKGKQCSFPTVASLIFENDEDDWK